MNFWSAPDTSREARGRANNRSPVQEELGRDQGSCVWGEWGCTLDFPVAIGSWTMAVLYLSRLPQLWQGSL